MNSKLFFQTLIIITILSFIAIFLKSVLYSSRGVCQNTSESYIWMPKNGQLIRVKIFHNMRNIHRTTVEHFTAKNPVTVDPLQFKINEEYFNTETYTKEKLFDIPEAIKYIVLKRFPCFTNLSWKFFYDDAVQPDNPNNDAEIRIRIGAGSPGDALKVGNLSTINFDERQDSPTVIFNYFDVPSVLHAFSKILGLGSFESEEDDPKSILKENDEKVGERWYNLVNDRFSLSDIYKLNKMYPFSNRDLSFKCDYFKHDMYNLYALSRKLAQTTNEELDRDLFRDEVWVSNNNIKFLFGDNFKDKTVEELSLELEEIINECEKTIKINNYTDCYETFYERNNVYKRAIEGYINSVEKADTEYNEYIGVSVRIKKQHGGILDIRKHLSDLESPKFNIRPLPEIPLPEILDTHHHFDDDEVQNINLQPDTHHHFDDDEVQNINLQPDTHHYFDDDEEVRPYTHNSFDDDEEELPGTLPNQPFY